MNHSKVKCGTVSPASVEYFELQSRYADWHLVNTSAPCNSPKYCTTQHCLEVYNSVPILQGTVISTSVERFAGQLFEAGTSQILLHLKFPEVLHHALLSTL